MLCEYFPPFDRGGTEWSVFHLARALKKKGHQVTIFTPNYGGKSTDQFSGINIFRFPYYLKLHRKHDTVSPFHFSHPGWWVWTAYCLGRLVWQQRPQVLHVQGKYFIPQAVIIGNLFRIPVVVTLRDYIVLCPHAYCLRIENGYRACNLFELFLRDLPTYFRHFKTGGIRRWLVIIGTGYAWLVSRMLRLFLNQVDVTVAISRKLRQVYAHNAVYITTTIYNVFLTPVVKRKKSEPYILFVGRLTEGKGFPLLLKAYNALRVKHPPKLMVIGEGRRKIKSPQKDVEYAGHLSYPQTLEYISQATLVVVPAVWEEPFGRVALESILQGTPVVVTNRGGLPEIVTNGVTGVVVEPNIQALVQGIERALRQNKRLRTNLRRELPQLQKLFFSQPVSKYEKLYRSLI